MNSDSNQKKMPLSLLALVGAGGALMLAGVILMHVANPPSSAPQLFEVLMMVGALCEGLFAFRCWKWLKSDRSP